MTQEEKAKRYDEVIKVARFKIKYDKDHILYEKHIYDILPELKESEDDIMRKMAIKAVYAPEAQSCIKSWGINPDDVTAWLEKQGEQKPTQEIEPTPIFKIGNILKRKGKDYTFRVDRIQGGYYHCDRNHGAFFPIEEQGNWELVEQNPADKVKPKFKVGDWVMENEPNNYARFIQILEVNVQGKERYRISRDLHNDEDIVECRFVENNYHPFNIQDAKDGDILCTYECDEPKIVFILKGTPKKPYVLGYHCYYNIMYPHFGSDFEKGCLAPNDKDVKPATKEQRDLLFSKIKEARYMWDTEKKELKKISQEIEPFEAEHGKYYYCIKDYFCGSRKQASKGDVVQALRGLPIMGLKNASEYFLPVNFIKCNSIWSKEDEKMFECALNMIEWYSGVDEDKSRPVSDWLKSLKGRVLPQQEWSKEDKERYYSCLKRLEAINSKWFKEHVGFQNRWKPSEEQMVALDGICSYIRNKADWEISQDMVSDLYKLSEQLKKLREE